MNPLKSVIGTIILGFVVAVVTALILSYKVPGQEMWSLAVWFHVLFGVVWIGLLYYFNFVQVPAVGAATAVSCAAFQIKSVDVTDEDSVTIELHEGYYTSAT